MSRLTGYDFRLANTFASLATASQREAALAICAEAISRLRIQNLQVDEALNALNNGRNLHADLVVALQRLAQEIEEPYLTALGKNENVAESLELINLFKRARAVESIVAFAQGNFEDALYEALHAGITTKRAKTIVETFKS